MTTVANLAAFARLYGYIRYFHPSDGARAVDWERFAVHGAGEVMHAAGPDALRDVLARLFAPLASSLVVYREGEPVRDVAVSREGGTFIAWQHLGLGGGGLVWGPFDPYRSVRVRRRVSSRRPGRLFAALPAPEQHLDKELAPGVRARFTLAAASGSWLRRRRVALGALGDALASLDPTTFRATDVRVRLAVIVVAWSTLQHFYPYFDVCADGWEESLPIALEAALGDRDEVDLERTLRRMLVALEDGHATVTHAGVQRTRGALPLLLQWIDEQLVVVETGVPEVERGDVVAALDGQSPATALRDAEALVSGSPQWRRWRGLENVGEGPLETPVELSLQRDGVTRTVRIARCRPWQWKSRRSAGPAIRTLEGGVEYVDLSRVTRGELKKRLPVICAAPGLIADMRGYPQNGNEVLLTHLLRERCEHQIFQVPQIVHPDHEAYAGWDGMGWRLSPRAPAHRGRVAFLCGPGAISYAESILGHVEGHGLGEIVGSASAGANGNINRTRLPAGFEILWTGMRVVKHDGSRHHGIGVIPTISVEPTLAGVRAGRDEVLDAALRALTS